MQTVVTTAMRTMTENGEGFRGRGLERKAVNCKKLSKR